MRPLTITPRHTITALALAPDGRQLGVVQENRFRLIDALTGAELARDPGGADVTEVSPTQRHTLSASRTAVRLAEVTAGTPFLKFQTGWAHDGPFNRPPAEPATSALQCVNVLFQLGETQHGSAFARRSGPQPANQFVMQGGALTADHRFAVGKLNSEQRHCVCDLATETVVARLERPLLSPDEPVRVAFAPNEVRVVALTPRVLAVYHLPPPPALKGLPPVSSPLVSASVTVHLTQPQPVPGVPPFAVLPCGQKVLVRGERSRVELRDLSTGEVLTVWKWGLSRLWSLAVAADGLTAAAAGARGQAVLWDLG